MMPILFGSISSNFNIAGTYHAANDIYKRIKKVLECTITATLLSLLIPLSAFAVTIFSTLSLQGGIQWKYDYNIISASTDPTINEVTIYFDRTFYTNLVVAKSPNDWDSIVVQSDPAIPADGFFDTLALTAGIAPGSSRSGFSVLFNFLGNGTPSTQSFEIVDPSTFIVLSTGITSVDSSVTPPPTQVPEPNILILIGIASLYLVSRNKRTTVK